MSPLDQVGEYVRFKCGLPLRINEMAAVMARVTGHSSMSGKRIAGGAASSASNRPSSTRSPKAGAPRKMAADEAIVYDFFTELFANKSVSDPTYARAVAKFGEKGVIDLLGVVGYYTMLAMVMNVARTPAQHGAVLPLIPMPQQMTMRKVAG
jgi:4-carboxymuconolactone decarboxylase